MDVRGGKPGRETNEGRDKKKVRRGRLSDASGERRRRAERLEKKPKTGSRETPVSDPVEQAARKTVANVVAKPITDFVMRSVPSERGGENAAAGEGEGIDNICEWLMAIADPARIPSAVAKKVVAHLTAHLTDHLLAATTLGPIGPVVVFFAGEFAGELTHEVFYGGQDAAGAEAAVGTIELADGFADAQIGRLAESGPFREYLGGLISEPIAAIIDGDARAAPDQRADEGTGRPATITAVVAAYEVRSPAGGSGSTARGGPVAVRVRPASFAALACIPKGAVTARFTSVSHEFLLLADGTLVKRRLHGASRRRWVQVSDWPGAKDPHEAKELLSRRGYQVVHGVGPATEPFRTLRRFGEVRPGC
jgi:hypothetical protein